MQLGMWWICSGLVMIWGWIEARGRPARVVAVDQPGADVIMVQDLAWYLQRRLKDDPEHVETLLVLAQLHTTVGNVKEAVKHVRGQGIKLRVRIPWNKKDKGRVVKEALDAGAERIIAGGGDGTINGVVNALVGKGKKKPRATMGILPLGTANDFARGCGLPTRDLNECLEIACTAEPWKTDVGRAGSSCFINVTSGGFGAEITATTPVDT